MYISMNNKEAGIKDKRVSEAVYPKDILADTEIKMCGLLAKGFWYECLFNMWHNDSERIEGSVLQLSKLLGCEKQEVIDCVEELKCNKVADVTDSNGIVTLVCRRLLRRKISRKNNAKRQSDYREKHKDNTPVADESSPPPVPSPVSSPVPVSTPKKNKDIKEREKDFIEQLKPYEGKYDTVMIRDFFLYWTEPNKTKTKMLFEMQKTWDTGKRLARWASNDFNGEKKSASNNRKSLFDTVKE